MPEARKAGSGSNPLKLRSFRSLMVGQATSQIGDQFFTVALAWYVLKSTGSTTQLGWVQAVGSIWAIAFLVFGGMLADRLRPLSVMRWADAARGLIVGLMAALAFSRHLTLPLLYVLAAFLGLASAIFQPAERALLPQMLATDQLAAANSIAEVVRQIAALTGPVLAGAVVAWKGPHAGFAVDFASYAISAITLMLIALPKSERTESTSPGLREAMSSLRTAIPWVSMLTFDGAFGLVGAITQVGFPVMAEELTGLGAAGLGILMGAFTVGAMLGAVLGGMLSSKWKTAGWVIVGTFLTAIVTFLMPRFHSLTGLLVCVGLLGAVVMVIDLVLMVALQQRFPGEQMGRIFGLLFAIGLSLQMVMTIVGGYVISMFGTAGLMYAATDALLLAGIVMCMKPVTFEAQGEAL